MFGEGIKTNTFTLTNYNSVSASYTYTLLDDSFGNLRDTAFDETKFVSNNNLLLYTGFNEKYREYNFKNKRRIRIKPSFRRRQQRVRWRRCIK